MPSSSTGEDMTFDEWTQNVDLLCRAHLACTWADLCGDMEPLKAGFDSGQTPLEFVHWFADKYDLHWIEPTGHRPHAACFTGTQGSSNPTRR